MNFEFLAQARRSRKRRKHDPPQMRVSPLSPLSSCYSFASSFYIARLQLRKLQRFLSRVANVTTGEKSIESVNVSTHNLAETSH